MPKKVSRNLTEDFILWQRVASQVTPLNLATQVGPPTSQGVHVTGRQNRASKKNVKMQKRMISAGMSFPPAAIASKKDTLKQVGPADLRHGEKAGIDGSTQRRLFRGEVSIDLQLDLHGMTAARAHKQLLRFIVSAADDGFRCVLVITGKGSGVLNGHVPNWLKQLPLSLHVLALAEARPRDGGSGAFYVLLRRKRGKR